MVISHKFIEERLVAYEFGDHKAVLPVDSHHEGKGHEDVGTEELQETGVGTKWFASNSATPSPAVTGLFLPLLGKGTPYI